MNFDYRLFQLLNNLAGKNKFFDSLVVFLGQDLAYIMIIALFIILLKPQINFFKKIKSFLMVFFAVISASVVRFIIVPLIALIVNRPRPFEAYQVIQLINKPLGSSFPSGHASFYFALAMVLYFFSKKFGVVFFVLSFLMAVSRVIAGVHYLSDILVGALLGICFVWISRNFIRKKVDFWKQKFSFLRRDMIKF